MSVQMKVKLRLYKCTVNVLNFQTLHSILFWHKICFFMQLFLKILSGVANSIDPDQIDPTIRMLMGPRLTHMHACIQTFHVTIFIYFFFAFEMADILDAISQYVLHIQKHLLHIHFESTGVTISEKSINNFYHIHFVFVYVFCCCFFSLNCHNV